MLEATLFGAGRPLLLVPPVPPATVGERVAIAWNDGAEAARAVAGALPFLDAPGGARADAATRRTDPEVAEDLVSYLHWRGIAAESQPVGVTDEPVGEALLKTATAAGADLLVMGGFGRTRFTSWCWAGSPGMCLSHPTMPVLMAH